MINVLIMFVYFKKELGVFQLPFLVACVSLTFVTPQLFNLLNSNYFDLSNNGLNIIFFSLCNIALAMGFSYSSRRVGNDTNCISFKSGKAFERMIYAFFIIGAMAMLLNRGAYKGGFVSGTYVVISFFSTYITVAFLLILIGIKYNLISVKIFSLIAIIIVTLIIDKIVASGRRGETINLFLMLIYFFLDRDERIYKYLRFLVPSFFFVGMILGSQIGKYRENAYSGKMSFIENISSLDFSQKSKKNVLEKGEIYNAFEGIKAASICNAYDFGASNWNGLVKDYVPTVLVSRSFKNSLLVEGKTDTLVGYLTRSGSTMTGYFDAYKSFGIFGFLKFLLLGLIMGYFWRKREDSDIKLLFYFSLLTPSLHLITHSSNFFISVLFFLIVFVYPFLKWQSTKFYYDVEEEGERLN